ncbi:membrane fusion protein, multidrug efflux system [Mucilaginibacter pineti]|uniref:Membrane fusion protein, multidrug efflux system n=1 Tax=Mucilaginibacter pineti TaxID=1391627 RepID=A0A1G7JN86_9SPHI|nr:HlyD family secretion protein [Mucilaginibacter pineti]SDF26407.1 membrane fusion protein, multidrug efflux system [Mucilaginibacter pineti]
MQNKTHFTIDRWITRITGIFAGIILLILIGWGILSLYQGMKYEQTNDAQIQEYINPIISRAGGFITKVNFQENQYLKKGDTLLVIDNRESTLQQEQAEAALLNSRSQLAVLESNVNSLKTASLVNKSQIKAASAKLLKQQQDYNRYTKLYEVESATKQQLETNKANLDVAAADYQIALDSYKTSLAKVNDTEAQQNVVRADIKKFQALLQRNRLDLSYTVIQAPYNCRIGKRSIEKGQMIEPGQILGYLVNKEAGKWVIANYKETQVNNMYIGEMARIDADAFPGEKFAGRIISLSPATGSSFSLLPPDNSTGNYVKIVQRIPVRIELEGTPTDNAGLEAGMNVTVTLDKDK